jgi:hypothetical protein
MRLPLILPDQLTAEQRPIYDDMREGIANNFKGFVAVDKTGTLIGPWNPWIHVPKFGGPVWDLVKALSSSPKLPKPVREVAILVTGSTLPTSSMRTSWWLSCAASLTTPLPRSWPASGRATLSVTKPLPMTSHPPWSTAALCRR